MFLLKEEDLELFNLFESTPDLICITGKDGYFKKINKAVGVKLGYTKKELLSRPVFSFLHPDDLERTRLEREKLFNGKPLLNFQNRYCTKKGELVWLEWTSIYVPKKELVFAIAKDITSRKLLEQEIEENYEKYKGLAIHFKDSMEKDRKSLAVGLHEDLAQLATAIKLDIDSVGLYVPEMTDALKKRLDHATAAANLLINTMRKLSFVISPNMLEDLGFHEAMKWLCREFSKMNNISCLYTSTVDETAMAHDMQLDIFRITQEWLTDATHLGTADKILIRIEEINGLIRLTITDNGKSLSKEATDQMATIGSIRKRVSFINGSVELETLQGKETSMCVTLKIQ